MPRASKETGEIPTADSPHFAVNSRQQMELFLWLHRLQVESSKYAILKTQWQSIRRRFFKSSINVAGVLAAPQGGKVAGRTLEWQGMGY